MAVSIPTLPTTANGLLNIDLGSDNETAFGVLENRFGDGYIQRAADGLNSNKDRWNVAWTNLTDAEMNLLYGFLRERAGYKPFYFLAPGDDVQKQWTARDLRKQPMQVSGQRAYWKLTATFTQAFGQTLEINYPQMLEGVFAQCSVGTIKGNAPTAHFDGVEAVGIAGIIYPQRFGVVGVSATGYAGVMLAGRQVMIGVHAEGVAGNIAPNANSTVSQNLSGVQATGQVGSLTLNIV